VNNVSPRSSANVFRCATYWKHPGEILTINHLGSGYWKRARNKEIVEKSRSDGRRSATVAQKVVICCHPTALSKAVGPAQDDAPFPRFDCFCPSLVFIFGNSLVAICHPLLVFWRILIGLAEPINPYFDKRPITARRPLPSIDPFVRQRL
jgi:hypothetical protein